MSKTAEMDTQHFSDTMAPLLREFAAKFAAITKEVVEVRTLALEHSVSDRNWSDLLHTRYDGLRELTQRLTAAGRKTAEIVSQRVTHGRVDEAVYAELTTRLAEFEGRLLEAQTIVMHGALQFKD